MNPRIRCELGGGKGGRWYSSPTTYTATGLWLDIFWRDDIKPLTLLLSLPFLPFSYYFFSQPACLRSALGSFNEEDMSVVFFYCILFFWRRGVRDRSNVSISLSTSKTGWKFTMHCPFTDWLAEKIRRFREIHLRIGSVEWSHAIMQSGPHACLSACLSWPFDPDSFHPGCIVPDLAIEQWSLCLLCQWWWLEILYVLDNWKIFYSHGSQDFFVMIVLKAFMKIVK